MAMIKGSIHKPNDSDLRAMILFKKTYGKDFVDHLLNNLDTELPYKFYITHRDSENCFFQSNSLMELSCKKFGSFTAYSIEKLLLEFGGKLSSLYYKEKNTFKITDFFPEITEKNCLTMNSQCLLPPSKRKRKNYMIPSFLMPFLLDYILDVDKGIVVMCLSQLRKIVSSFIPRIEKDEQIQVDTNCKTIVDSIKIRLTQNNALQWVLSSSKGRIGRIINSCGIDDFNEEIEKDKENESNENSMENSMEN